MRIDMETEALSTKKIEKGAMRVKKIRFNRKTINKTPDLTTKRSSGLLLVNNLEKKAR